jgi:hypothetical protein
MKFISFILICSYFFVACNNSNNTKKVTANNSDTLKNQRFFPVTNYFKGQWFDIKQKGINPLKYTTVGTTKDSTFLKVEDWEKEMAEFLSPIIDSTNLNELFLEKKFKDQSINAITLTYDSVKTLPDSLSLKGWNIYINPETGNVQRIFLTKQTQNKTVQLIWNNDKDCKITYILPKPDGSFTIEKEIFITWDY